MNDDLEIAEVAPDVILPGQITCGARCDGTTSGARALMTAILDDALLCIARGRRRRRWQTLQRAADAEAWVRADDPPWLFSFASICDVLGIDAGALRDRIGASGGAARAGTPVRTGVTRWRKRSSGVAHGSVAPTPSGTRVVAAGDQLEREG